MTAAKTYRIERGLAGRRSHIVTDEPMNIDASLAPAQTQHAAMASDDPRLSEIMNTLRELRGFLDPSQRMATDIIDTYRKEMGEVYALRNELDKMKQAIESTKSEIASLHVTEKNDAGMRRVSGELDAVVSDTERATTSILSATEEIENQAGVIRAMMGATNEPLEIIQEKVIQLYESCNFQDLTGQRITKIIRTLGFVENRLDRMIKVWGGIEAFREFEGSAERFQAFTSDKAGDALLNGPKLEEDAGHVSQDDINALFD